MALTRNQKIGIGVVGTALLIGGGAFAYSRSKKVKLIKNIKNFPSGTIGTVNVIEKAKQLGMDMGYAYGSLDPRRWTENDNAVVSTIAQFPKSLMPQLVKEYYNLYKRDLQEDVQKLLPASDYANIRDKFI